MTRGTKSGRQTIEDRAVGVLTDYGKDGERACEMLRKAGYYVIRVPDSSCASPLARRNGRIYEGVSEIQEFIRADNSES